MSRAFDLGNKIRKQRNGIANPPNEQARIAPPNWRSEQLFLVAGTYSFTVPQNVYQILAMVWGGGAASWAYNLGGTYTNAGGGGGFAMGIIDVVPGQVLPIITVGSKGTTGAKAGGTSSVGTLLTATGGSAPSSGSGGKSIGGTGAAALSLRQSKTANGGDGGQVNGTFGVSGGSAGSVTGNGSTGGYLGDVGLLKLANKTASISTGATTPTSGNTAQKGRTPNTLTDMILNPYLYTESTGGDITQTTNPSYVIYGTDGGAFGIGGNVSGSTAVTSTSGAGGFGAPGGNSEGANTQLGKGGFGAPGGICTLATAISSSLSGNAAGASSGYTTVNNGGDGAVILAWTEGY